MMCLDTAISGPRLIRAWKRRYWIEYCFRTLKHLLATGACQVHSEDAYYGPSSLTLDGVFCLDVHLTGGMQRAAHDGGDYLQSQTLLALCRLRSL